MMVIMTVAITQMNKIVVRHLRCKCLKTNKRKIEKCCLDLRNIFLNQENIRKFFLKQENVSSQEKFSRPSERNLILI